MSHPLLEDLKEKYETALSQAVKESQKRFKERSLPLFEDYSLELIREELAKLFAETFSVSVDFWKEHLLLEAPPAHVSVDLAIPTFLAAEKLGLPPLEVVKKMSLAFEGKVLRWIERGEAAGPFLNLILRKEEVYAEVLLQTFHLKDDYGGSNIGKGETALLEYSSPNIAKPIGIGQMRSTIIGQALGNIFESLGYVVLRDNFLGDWGAQFGKVLWAYLKWGEKEGKAPTLEELKNYYVAFHEAEEKDPHLKEEAAAFFQKMEDGDEALIALWKQFREISIQGYEETYKRLGVRFDTYSGESLFIDSADELIEECMDKDVCRLDTASQAVIVDSFEDTPSFIVRKADGASLYIGRDLAALRFRLLKTLASRLIVVVGDEQKLHFKQLFSLARVLGYLRSAEPYHVGFGTVLVDGKKMSTRKGSLVELQPLLEEAVKKAREILNEKEKEDREKIDASEIEELAEMIGVGAIVYNDLKQDRLRNVDFDWDRMLDLQKGSALYLQYTHARLASVLRKASPEDIEALTSLGATDIKGETAQEFSLAKKLLFFPTVVRQSGEKLAPHFLAVYLEELTQLFNAFYEQVNVLATEDVALRRSRLLLVKVVAITLKNGLGILGVRVPEKM